ncbi:MAG: hypothetical protein LBT18_03760 [Endomicrobium sp.]|jgi:hypothetical protein|nr:hypothetical protein [Endomicrobium sp.]
MRMGWALPNPVSRLDVDRTTCPFAYLEAVNGQSYGTQVVTIAVKDNGATPAAISNAYVNINGSKKKLMRREMRYLT